jgi:hypothetical protein
MYSTRDAGVGWHWADHGRTNSTDPEYAVNLDYDRILEPQRFVVMTEGTSIAVGEEGAWHGSDHHWSVLFADGHANHLFVHTFWGHPQAIHRAAAPKYTFQNGW